MNFYILAFLGLVAIANIAEATFVIGTTATAGTVAISSGSAALGLLGGVIILKGLLLGTMLARRRGKRSVDEDDAAFAVLAASEPAQCYRRLICDLAAGAIPDKDNLTTLFDGIVDIRSPKFEFKTAAQVGKMVKQAQACEIRYSCPLSTLEIEKLF